MKDVGNATGTNLNGAYRLEALLGRGGMGAVYRAVQLSVNRPVAVKLVTLDAVSEAMQPMLLKRFEREAVATSRLSHPNTVRLYDFGVADGTPFLVLELLVGESLRARLDRVGALSSAEAIAVVQPIASALTEAHGLGIVHRDLKPDNIFLSRIAGTSGLPDVVKVMDFGIASWREETTNITGQQVLGTVRYMAPEQLMAGRPTPATDVYALGVMLFEMLTGATPFQGRPEAIMAQHLARERPPLPATLEPAWGGIIDRMLAKDPAERFPDTAALLEAIERRRTKLATLAVPDDLADYHVAVMDADTDALRPGIAARSARRTATDTAEATGMAGAPAKRSRAWLWAALGLALAGGITVGVVALGGRDAKAPNVTTETVVASTTSPPTLEPTVAPSAPDALAAAEPEVAVAPDARVHEAVVPDAVAPDVVAPDAVVPDTTPADTTTPETSTPEATAPEATAPEASPAPIVVHVVTKPAGASVAARTAEGERTLCVKAPCDVSLAAGDGALQIVASLAGHLPTTLELVPGPSTPREVTLVLKKKPRGPTSTFELPP